MTPKVFIFNIKRYQINILLNGDFVQLKIKLRNYLGRD